MNKEEVKYRMTNSCNNCIHSDDVGVDEVVIVCKLLDELVGLVVEVDGLCEEHARDDRKKLVKEWVDDDKDRVVKAAI